MKKLFILLALAAAATASSQEALAQIEHLDLQRMMRRCDDVVHGRIVARQTFFVDEPGGPGLFFTTLTLEGFSLKDGVRIQVDVNLPGGFIDKQTGVHNSEAPGADDTALGSPVVVFYKWLDDMGGGVGGNVVYAAKGGLYRTVEGPIGPIALGRGEGFAVTNNTRVDLLKSAVRRLRVEQR